MSIQKKENQHGEITLTSPEHGLKLSFTPEPFVGNYQLQIDGIGNSYLCWSKARARALRDMLNSLPLDD